MADLIIDFETRSTCDLRSEGLDHYVRCEHTDVWCLAWAWDSQPEVHVWRPGDPAPQQVLDHVERGGLVVAHNASFEYAIWNHIMEPRYGWPRLSLEQLSDTMARALRMGLPGKLELAAQAAGLDIEKDMAGHRLMLQMSRPRRMEGDTPVWWDSDHTRDRVGELIEYCRQDVRVEQALHQRLAELEHPERLTWLLDQRINRRGVPVDLELARAMRELVALESERCDREMRELTGGEVDSCQATGQLRLWLSKVCGLTVASVDKASVLEMLANWDLPPEARQALQLRQEAGRTSTAKLDAIIRTAVDGRVRRTLQYYGASTGRWAGRIIQPQNLPRPSYGQEDIERFVELIVERRFDELPPDRIGVAASCIRAVICAEHGKVLTAGDWSNIEGRILAWLAGEEWKLQAFREFDAGVGPDLYVQAYSRSYGIPVEDVDDQMRLVGKVQELALGYQGGVGAFQTMARAYNLEVEDERADELKLRWRDAHPRVTRLWTALERAAVAAVQDPQRAYAVQLWEEARVMFTVSGSFLLCTIPSGRTLYYPYPSLELRETPWGEQKEVVTYMGFDSRIPGAAQRWTRIHTYGGKLTENIVQALARDVLVAGLHRLVNEFGTPVMHVHDEVVTEHAPSRELTPERLEEIMCRPLRWAPSLPLAAKGWQGRRFRK